MKRNCLSYLKRGNLRAKATNVAAVQQEQGKVAVNQIEESFGDCLVSLKMNLGTRDEDYDHAGATHFIKRFFYGPTNYNTQLAFINYIEQAGCNVRVEHGREELVYIVQGPTKEHVAPVFHKFLEHVMVGRYIDWDLPPKRQAVAYDIHESLEVPEIIVSDALHDAAFGGEGLGRGLIAPSFSLNTITVDKLLEFMDEHFAFENMTINSVGFDGDELQEYASLIPKVNMDGKLNKRERSKYIGGSKHISEHRFTDTDPKTYSALAFRGESIQNNTASIVLANILGEGSKRYTGRLYSGHRLKSLIESEETLIDTKAFVNSYSDDGLFGVYYTSTSGKKMKDVMQKTVAQLQDIAKGNVSEDEVKGASLKALREFYDQSNTTNGAHQNLLDGLSVATRAKGFTKITPEAVSRTAKALLESKPTIVSYGSTGGVPREL